MGSRQEPSTDREREIERERSRDRERERERENPTNQQVFAMAEQQRQQQQRQQQQQQKGTAALASAGTNDGRDTTIHHIKLRGHKSSVLCLAHSSNNVDNTPGGHASLLSGSEDKTARLWDLRAGAACRAGTCIIAPGEVTSVAFYPNQNGPKGKSPSSVVTAPFGKNHTVYLGVGNRVLGYDLRKATSPIIKEISNDLTDILNVTEEVNQISFSLSSRGATMIAVADDGGNVRCTEPSHRQRKQRVLQHDTDGLAMVTSCSFRPRGGNQVAVGGTDCTVSLWDPSKPKRPLASYLMPRDDTGAQICNPPMVHTVGWSPSGRLLATGLGDGTIGVLKVQSDASMSLVTRLRDGHDASVASVIFPSFGQLNTQHVAAKDRLLASAGTDGAIFLWDLGASVCGRGAVNPSTILAGTDSLEDTVDRMSIKDGDDDDGPRLLFGIPHRQKPNWMVSSRGADSAFASALFVADTTNDITAYSIPLL